MREVVIVSGTRTAVGNFGGSLKDVSAVKVGATAIREAVRKAGLKPVTKKEVLDVAPEMFKGVGLIELEKTYYTGHFGKVAKTLLNMLVPRFPEHEIEAADRFKESKRWGASNIVCVFSRR